MKKKMNWRMFVSFLSLVFIMSLFLVACSTEDDPNAGNEEDGSKAAQGGETDEPTQGGDLIVASTTAPTTFNSYYTTQGSDQAMAGLMFDSLNDVDESGNPTPQLAKDWEYSDDGKTLTFHLRDDVKWHDGEPFTADDVVFTYNIPLSDDYTGPRASYFELIEKVEAPDDYTVKLTLREPSAQLMVRTTTYEIYPKHILEDIPIGELDKADFNTKNPIGTGPFKFEEWVQGQYVKFVANEDYFEGRPYVDTLIRKEVPDSNAMLAQFKAGDIHIISVSSDDVPEAEALVADGKAELIRGLSSSYSMIEYNHRNPLFQDKKVRQALSHALDREAMVEAVLGDNGEVAHSPAIPFLWAFNEDIPKFEYDTEKAKQLLAEAGWKEVNEEGVLVNDAGEEFTFSLLATPTNETRKQMAQIAQQQWSEIGVNANIELVEANALLDQVGPPNWDFDANLLGWSVALDPSLTNFFHTNAIEGGLNRGGYSNPELDRLMEEADQTVDREKRKVLEEEIQAIIAEDQPSTYLYYSTSNQIHVPELHGVVYHPSASFYKINEWWLEQ